MNKRQQQIVNALERAAMRLEYDVRKLLAALDYSCEFPASDAELIREAIMLMSVVEFRNKHTRLEVESEAYRITDKIAERDSKQSVPEIYWTRMDALRAFIAGYRYAAGVIDDSGFRTGVHFATIPEFKE